MQSPLSRYGAIVTALLLLVTLVGACGGPAPSEPVAREVVTTPVDETSTTETDTQTTSTAETEDSASTSSEEFTTPHPILSDIRVRRALAYCTNRLELIESVYPFLSKQDQESLLMDTFLPKSHWAYTSEEIMTYPFDPARGQQLLEEAGWGLKSGEEVRTNRAGDRLSLKFLSTDAQFRQTWAAVMEQQLLTNCGIQMVRNHAPSTFVFGDTTGLARRDFDLAAYAWVGETDPKGTTLYACNQIPLPSNTWEGQNVMGWCNERASQAVIAANNSLGREDRAKNYAIVQQEFTKDMVSLPLFNRFEAAASSLNLINFKPNPTEYYVANSHEWEMKDGSDTVVLGFSQEPTTLFSLVESNGNTRMLSMLTNFLSTTGYNYDYQPVALTRLPTLENGGAILKEVEVKEGDKVWSVDGDAIELKAGAKVINPAGDSITYNGGPLKMTQLKVTFEYTNGLKWEDGEPVTKADYELTAKIICDKESGAVTYNLCDSYQKLDFINDTSYTITYLPGASWSSYSVYDLTGYGLYPAHRTLSDGRKLADVPAKEWQTLPEVAEKPLSTGAYRILEWQKGQRIELEANPSYILGEPTVKHVTVVFFADTNQAVAQLLSGEIDVLGSETLAGGAEIETVLNASDEGKIRAYRLVSPSWEHLDMNLFTK